MTELRVPLGPSARDLVGVVFRRRLAILICYLVIVAGTALYCFFWPPSYEATVRYLVKNDRLQPLLTAEQEGIRTVSRPSVTEADLNSEAEIMQSHAVLEQTVRELKLERATEHWAVRLLRAPLEAGKDVYNSYHERPAETAVGRAVRRLGAAIYVEPQRESSVILVRLRWGHPNGAQEILTQHSHAYRAQHLSVRRAPDATRFFAAQVERTKVELGRIDADIATIRPGATSEQLEADRALAARQAAEFEAEWRKAQALQSEERARIAGVEAQLDPLPAQLVLQDRSIVSAEALEALKLRVLDLRLQRTELMQKYDPSHRLLAQVQERLVEAEQMLADEERRSYTERTIGRNQTADTLDQTLRTTRAEIDALAARERAAIGQDQALRAKVAALDASAMRVRDLERERASVQRSLEEYIRQLEEARVNDAMQFVNVAVIEPVSAGASPVSPQIGLLMKLALGLGLFVSVALGFALDFLDHRVTSDRELEAAVGVPVLAVFDRYPGKTGGYRHRA